MLHVGFVMMQKYMIFHENNLFMLLYPTFMLGHPLCCKRQVYEIISTLYFMRLDIQGVCHGIQNITVAVVVPN